MINSSNIKLIYFLRNLADLIEKKQLNSIQTKLIGEFYLSYQFQEETLSENNTINDIDLIKFCSLGYYIYRKILKDETL
jgi:uncharacterized protein YneF (UPF0154 family)